MFLQIIFAHLLFLFIGNDPQSKNPDFIIGKWKTVQNNLTVEVYKKNDEYRAKILWFKNTEDNNVPIEHWVDEQNPVKELRDRKILGLEILRGMTYNSEDFRWENGRIYDSSSGKEYSSSAWLQENKLFVRGFWKVEFLGKNLVFERVKSQ